MTLDNRKALVTGGASGFGFDIATKLSERGALVAIADVSADSAEPRGNARWLVTRL